MVTGLLDKQATARLGISKVTLQILTVRHRYREPAGILTRSASESAPFSASRSCYGDSRELERALETMDHERPDALILLVDPLTMSQRLRIVEFAREERLPAIYEVSQFVEAGGLMSYGPNVDDLVRRAATYVDKILRGANRRTFQSSNLQSSNS